MGNHDEALFRDASDFNPHARGRDRVHAQRVMRPRLVQRQREERALEAGSRTCR